MRAGYNRALIQLHCIAARGGELVFRLRHVCPRCTQFGTACLELLLVNSNIEQGCRISEAQVLSNQASARRVRRCARLIILPASLLEPSIEQFTSSSRSRSRGSWPAQGDVREH